MSDRRDPVTFMCDPDLFKRFYAACAATDRTTNEIFAILIEAWTKGAEMNIAEQKMLKKHNAR